jgi:hypothetical protein
MKRELCDGCCKLSDIHGALCETCSGDYQSLMKFYQNLINLAPELRTMTPPQVFLRLATGYIQRRNG